MEGITGGIQRYRHNDPYTKIRAPDNPHRSPGSQTTPWPCFIRSTMAFFMIRLDIGRAEEFALDGSGLSLPRNGHPVGYIPPMAVPWSPGTIPQRSLPGKLPTFRSIRSVVRRKYLHGRWPHHLQGRLLCRPPPGKSHSRDPGFLFSGLPPGQNDRVQSVHILLSQTVTPYLVLSL